MKKGSTKTLLVIALLVFGLSCSTQIVQKPTPAPAQTTADQQYQTSTQTAVLTGVQVFHTARQSRITLIGNSHMTFATHLQSSPPAIIIDLAAKADPAAVGRTFVGRGILKEVEVTPLAGNSGRHRVKVSLKNITDYHIDRQNNNLVLVIENNAAASSLNTPSVKASSKRDAESWDRTQSAPSSGRANIRALYFEPVGTRGSSRLAISSSRQITPKVVARDQGRTIILSITPASIGRHLLRPMDTSYFVSAVNYINPSMSGNDTVNLTIRLRQAVPYYLVQEGNVTYLEFDPSDVPPKKMPGAAAAGKKMAAARMASNQPSEKTQSSGMKEKDTALEAYRTSTGRTYSGQRISLDFQNADIHHILRLIAEVSEKNVVISNDIKGKVTLRLKDVPWDQALDIVLASQNLGVEVVGNVMRVERSSKLLDEKKKRQIEQELEDKDKEVLITRIWTPKYASVKKMKNLLEPLKSPQGSIKVIGNDVFIQDKDDIIRLMADVFQKNDKVSKQILIEARIVEANTSFSKNLGLNWGGGWSDPRGKLGGLLGSHSLGGALTVSGLYGATNHAINLISPPATGLGLGLSFATSALDLTANLYAMEQSGEGRIISAPRILANNDEEVYIKQGQSIPFESAGTATEPAKISYKEAVLSLHVTPHIEENGEIISMEILVTKDTPDYSKGTRNPPINKREAKTKLMIRDGETVVIGGIIIDTKSKSVNRIPGLHKIPFFGYLFKNYEVKDDKVELLIFITAHIIPVKI